MPNKPSPPPVSELHPSRNPDPMLITPGSKQRPQSNRLALHWPSSRSNGTTHQSGHALGGGENGFVPIAEQGKTHTSYVVTPSGLPVVKVQSIYQGYFTHSNNLSSTPAGHPLFGGINQGTPGSSPRGGHGEPYSERTGSFISFDESWRPRNKRTITRPDVPGKKVVLHVPNPPSQVRDNSRDEGQMRKRMGHFNRDQRFRDLSNDSIPQVYSDRSGNSLQLSENCTPDSERKQLNHSYKKRYQALNKHPTRNGVCQMCCWFLMTVVVFIILCISLSIIFEEKGKTPVPLTPSQKMKLKTYLNQNLFGQPIAVSEISSRIDRFLVPSNNETSVVMSFHGGVGVGKSFASRLLADYFFSADQKVSCVGTFYVPLHHSRSTEDSLTSLQDWLEPKEAGCAFRILIVDGLGGDTPCSLVSLLQDSISTFLKGKFIRKHIIIFSTDIAALRISDISLKYQEGNKQEVLAIDQFSHPIKHSWGAIDEFLQQTAEETCHFTGFTRIINYSIPFVPLERRHVRRCAVRDAADKGMTLSESQLNWVTDQLSYVPPSWPVFSESGCKLISQKVDLLNAVGEF